MLSAMLAATLVAAAPAGPVTLFPLPEGLTEVSGIAYGASGTLYVHEDSGADSVIHALGPDGALTATYDLDLQARDWEDMAAGPDGTVLVADIGDNNGRRNLGVLVHRFAEPTGPTGTVPEVESIRLNYEDSPRDAETLLVHPRTGQTLVITRSPLGSAVYAAPQPLEKGLLRRVAAFPTRSTGSPGGPVVGIVSQRLVTAGDVSPDGRRIAVRTYTDAYLFDVPGEDLIEAFDQDPLVLPLPERFQGEALTWTPDSSALVVTGEGDFVPVEQVPVPVQERTEDGSLVTAPEERSSSRRTEILISVGVGLGALLLVLLLRARVRRTVRRQVRGERTAQRDT